MLAGFLFVSNNKNKPPAVLGESRKALVSGVE